MDGSVVGTTSGFVAALTGVGSTATSVASIAVVSRSVLSAWVAAASSGVARLVEDFTGESLGGSTSAVDVDD